MLEEIRRKQLEEIVGKMKSQNAQDHEIEMVVMDFIGKFDPEIKAKPQPDLTQFGKTIEETPIERMRWGVEEKKQEEIFRRGEEAKEYLKQPWYKQILPTWLTGAKKTEFHEEFGKLGVKALAKTAVDIAIKMPVRVVKSLIETPETFIRGGIQLMGKEVSAEPLFTRGILEKVPYVKDVATFQEDAAKRAGQIVGEAFGEEAIPTFLGVEIPWQARALLPFGQVPLEVIATTAGFLRLKDAISKQIDTLRYKQAVKDMIPQKPTPTQYKTARLDERVVKGKIQPTTEMKEVAKDTQLYTQGVKRAEDKISILQNQAGGMSEYIIRPELQQGTPLAEKQIEVLTGKINALSSKYALSPESQAAVLRIKEGAVDYIVGSGGNPEQLYTGRILFDQEADTFLKLFKIDPANYKAVHDIALQVRVLWNDAIAGTTSDPDTILKVLEHQHNLYTGAELINKASPMPISLWKRIPWWTKTGLVWAGGTVLGWLGLRGGGSSGYQSK